MLLQLQLLLLLLRVLLGVQLLLCRCSACAVWQACLPVLAPQHQLSHQSLLRAYHLP